MRLRPSLPPAGSLLWLTPAFLALLAWVFEPAGVRVEVQQLTWRYEAKVEQLRDETDSDWCDQLPAGADVIDRRTITEPRPDHATPAERCRYHTTAWRTLWLARAQGLRGQTPQWPHPALSTIAPPLAGAQRLGKREAFHEVMLRARDGRTWTCRLDFDHWQRQPLGEHLRLPVDRFGVANCGGLH